MLPITAPQVITPTFQTTLDHESTPTDPYQTLRRGLWITSAVLGLGAAVTFKRSMDEYDELLKLSKIPSTGPNPTYGERSDDAEMAQSAARVMTVLASTSLISSLFLIEW